MRVFPVIAGNSEDVRHREDGEYTENEATRSVATDQPQGSTVDRDEQDPKKDGSDRHSGKRHDPSYSRPAWIAKRFDATARRFVTVDNTTTKVEENPGTPLDSDGVTCVAAPVKLAERKIKQSANLQEI